VPEVLGPPAQALRFRRCGLQGQRFLPHGQSQRLRQEFLQRIVVQVFREFVVLGIVVELVRQLLVELFE